MDYEFPILRNLSWLPYDVFCKMRVSNRNPIYVDMGEYRIDKRFWLSLPPEDDGLSNQLRTFGFREPLNCRCYVDFITPDDVLLDIGANIGFFVLLGSSARRVICVEPLNNVIGLLEKNIQQNGLGEKCKVLHAAVGPKGQLFLEVNNQLNLSRIVSERNENTIDVQSIPLRELVAEHKSNMVRLDVEGFEYDLLYDQIPAAINKISMEFHTGLLGEEKSRRLLRYFSDEGFSLKYLVEDVPLRLYPFVHVLKGTGISRFVSYIRHDLGIEEAVDSILTGRALKYLYLQRNV